MIRAYATRIMDLLFGYDYFIAHRSKDAKPYALALHDALTEKNAGLDCFLDVKHYGSGNHLPSMQSRALKKTSRLIVICTPHAHDNDTYLLKEIREFQKLHPSGVVVPICDYEKISALNKATSPLLQVLPPISTTVCINEPEQALAFGNPTLETITKLLNDFSEERNSVKRLRWIQRVAALLFLLLAVSITLGIIANTQRILAQQRGDAIQRRAIIASAISSPDPLLACQLLQEYPEDGPSSEFIPAALKTLAEPIPEWSYILPPDIVGAYPCGQALKVVQIGGSIKTQTPESQLAPSKAHKSAEESDDHLSAIFDESGKWACIGLLSGDIKVINLLDNTIRQWEWHHGVCKPRGFLGDGRFLLTTAHDNNVVLWDLEATDGAPRGILGTRKEGGINLKDARLLRSSFAFGAPSPASVWPSHDGNAFIVHHDSKIEIWEIRGSPRVDFHLVDDVPCGGVRSIDVLGEKRMACVLNLSGMVEIFEWRSGSIERRFLSAGVSAAAFNPTGEIVAVTKTLESRFASTISLLSTEAHEASTSSRIVAIPVGTTNQLSSPNVSSLHWDRSGKILLIAYFQGSPEVWHFSPNSASLSEHLFCVGELLGHSETPIDALIAGDVILTRSPGMARVWRIDKLLQDPIVREITVPKSRDPTSSFDGVWLPNSNDYWLLPEERLVSRNHNHPGVSLRYYVPFTEREIWLDALRSYSQYSGTSGRPITAAHSVSIGPNGNWLLLNRRSDTEATTTLYPLNNSKIPGISLPTGDLPYSTAFSGNNSIRVLSGTSLRSVAIDTLQLSDLPSVDMELPPDAFLSSSGTYIIWHAQNPDAICWMNIQSREKNRWLFDDKLAVRSGGNLFQIVDSTNELFVFLSNGEMRVVSLLSGREQSRFIEIKPPVTSMSVSSAADRVCVTRANGLIQVWRRDLGKQNLALVLELQIPGEVSEASLAPNGKTLAARSRNGRTWMWRIDQSELRTRLMESTLMPLSAEQRSNFLFESGD